MTASERRVRDMLDAGTITAEEAERLLEALRQPRPWYVLCFKPSTSGLPKPPCSLVCSFLCSASAWGSWAFGSTAHSMSMRPPALRSDRRYSTP